MNPEDQAREKIEAMQRLNADKALILTLKRPSMVEKTVEQQLQELKRKYQRLKTIIVNALVALDIILKCGLPFALWVWPLPKDNWMQAIALGSFVLVITIISKTITRIKTHDQE